METGNRPWKMPALMGKLVSLSGEAHLALPAAERRGRGGGGAAAAAAQRVGDARTLRSHTQDGRHAAAVSRERLRSPSLQTPQAPILLLPWLLSRWLSEPSATGQKAFKRHSRTSDSV